MGASRREESVVCCSSDTPLSQASEIMFRSLTFCLLFAATWPKTPHLPRKSGVLLTRQKSAQHGGSSIRRVSKCNSRAARPAGRPGAASTRSRRHIWYCSRGPTPTAAHRRRQSQISSAVEPRNTGVRRSFIKRSSSRRKGHRASSWLGRSRSIDCLQLRRHGKHRRQSSRSRRPSCCHRLRRMSCCSSER